MDQPETAFKGIFIINGKVYPDEQIRDLLSKNGRLEFTFSAPPVLGIYTSNDVNAIRKWGKAARNGAIFVEAKNSHQ
ncbi:hypothetical protein DYBT9275_00072 [Dyadobacter sp. CECT 9275]|uniref:Uncharacterized protein n=2 Tax=Dyadobacter helix TaxID=2822344 RepID=A0A916J6C8_9BACT|nr:hypothetical protein DYBT9275_00072 [Dyadobacter sp. CECT 9275]